MKLRLGIACIVASVLLGSAAATSYHVAVPATVLALIFAVLGLGLIDEATDPRRKPNPRTTPIEVEVAIHYDPNAPTIDNFGADDIAAVRWVRNG